MTNQPAQQADVTQIRFSLPSSSDQQTQDHKFIKQ
jgi:hypothetical protein